MAKGPIENAELGDGDSTGDELLCVNMGDCFVVDILRRGDGDGG